MPPQISFTDGWGLAAIAVAMILGGILKGATGAGIPIIAIPVIAAVYDVKIAVAVMVVPNLISNCWQIYRFRGNPTDKGFCWQLAAFGAIGAGIGTVVLAELPSSFLSLCMAAIVIAYILLRIAKPSVHLSMASAKKIVAAISTLGGILQGAVGISAPAVVTFLSAMKLARPAFIFTVSIFFASMAAVQIPVQIYYGLLTTDIATLGLLAFVPLFAALPVGDWIGRRMSPRVFDALILTFLAILAIRLIYVELF
ncbi:sulfite exporter TauE/SafE family protein [Hoeflea sp. YIM 152468]|uniref:sulfite exporter TauE/SafE family protein n=1 Tax=Hoeflea sp. YIM 152468 TaxID=3031759 RepID=UPI0023DB2FA7|nr:sulfite exporter TauE/SafE family protein [Hoeflea sp. YIM 152468]MDF1608818.1 sulfite exporter TauE/SafE family protein [Hoeflea sp. YIM 152468]